MNTEFAESTNSVNVSFMIVDLEPIKFGYNEVQNSLFTTPIHRIITKLHSIKNTKISKNDLSYLV